MKPELLLEQTAAAEDQRAAASLDVGGRAEPRSGIDLLPPSAFHTVGRSTEVVILSGSDPRPGLPPAGLADQEAQSE